MNTIDSFDKQRIIETLKLSLGDNLVKALLSHQVDELMLNPDGKLFVLFKDGNNEVIDNFDNNRAQVIVRTVASLNLKDIPLDSPIIDGKIDFLKARFSAILPPLTKATCFCIRSLHALNLPFEDLIKDSFISLKQAKSLEDLLIQRKNILVCGKTGCGKTSFINSILNKLTSIDEYCRIICIEDTPELELKCSNSVSLYTSKSTTMSDLVKATLRLSPDRIVIGEVRSVEALDMIDALSTGHSGGLASIHAGSVEQCFERLKLLISRNKFAPKNIDKMIALAINAVVILEKSPYRHVKEIALVSDYQNGSFIYQKTGI